MTDRRRDPAGTPGSLKAVLDGNYCIGCGACVHAAPGRISQQFQPEGQFRPTVSDNVSEAELEAAARVCPFTGAGPDEDEIAAGLYAELPAHKAIGRHALTLAGSVAEDGYRERGSSGGFASWIVSRLLAAGHVDGVVHVRPVEADAGEPIFRYGISWTEADIRRGAKSRYYPVDLSEVLAEIGRHPGKRFAFIGLPCFIKALRLSARQDPAISKAIGATIAIVCGHLKSTAFGDYLAWQVGIAPGELQTIDFRHKLSDRKASSYAFRAESRDGRSAVQAMADSDGGNWGLGYFKLKACDYCDDVVGETADVSIGDAWLPKFVDDPRGTNVVVVRSATVRALVEEGQANGQLAFETVTADDVARSQDAGLRHRREGLAWRLFQARREGRWAPPKRVKPAVLVNPKRRQELDLRVKLAAESHLAFAEAREAGDIGVFRRRMEPLVKAYRTVNVYNLRDRIALRLWTWFGL